MSAVPWADGAVVAYSSGVATRSPMLWSSPDLVDWRRAVPEPADGPYLEARTVVIGGPGLAVLGAELDEELEPAAPRLWLSRDGSHWMDGAANDDFELLWGVPGRLVAFGRSTWVSGDGLVWREVGPSPWSTSRPPTYWATPIVDDGDAAIVIGRLDVSDSRSFVYRLTSLGEWERLSEVPGRVWSAVRGPTGIVALGSDGTGPATWLSTDGRSWQSGSGEIPEIGQGALVGVATGFVAVGRRSYYHGCDGDDPYAQIVRTWTSGDGLAWQLLPEDVRLDHVELPVVLPVGGRLLAVGLQWEPTNGNEFDRSSPSVWESQAFEPGPSHTPLPVAEGCS